MKRILGIFIFTLVLTVTAEAAPTSYETEDAYEASQKARNIGVQAFRAGEFEKALDHMEEALEYRPYNPLLLGYVAYLSARVGDTGRTLEVASTYARLGLAPGPEVRASLAAALPPEERFGIAVRFDRALRPEGKAEVKFLLPADILLVEGLTFDTQGTLYISSVVSGGIWRMDATGPVQILDAAAHGLGSIFGMAIADGHLFATYAHIPQTKGFTEGEQPTGIVKLNPTTGEILATWQLQDDGSEHQLADIIVTSDGGVFASDAIGKAVYQLNGDTLFPLFKHPGFGNPQGLAETKAGQLILADYSRGLWRLDRQSGDATLLGVPIETSLHGIDGLTRVGNQLMAIQNGVRPQRILALTLSDDASKVRSVKVRASNLEDFHEPTLGAVGPDGYYFIASSQWPKYGANGSLLEGEKAEPTAIMKLLD